MTIASVDEKPFIGCNPPIGLINWRVSQQFTTSPLHQSALLAGYW